MHDSPSEPADSTDALLRRPTNVRLLVLAMLAAAAGSAYLTRICIAVATTTIQADLGLTELQMGWILGAFGWGYLIAQIPSGWLGDRLGGRLVFSASSLLWSLMTVWTSAAGGYAGMLLSRFGFGMAQAGLAPLSARIIRDWIPETRRGSAGALIAAFMSVGGVFAMSVTAWLLEMSAGNWRLIFFGYSAVGIVWAIAFYALFRNRPGEHPWVNAAERELIAGEGATGSTADASQPVVDVRPIEDPTDEAEGGDNAATDATPSSRSLFVSPSLWGLCIQSYFRAAGYLLIATWFPAFLEWGYSVRREQAGLLTSVPLIAMVVGSLFGGVVVDRLMQVTGSRRLSRSGTAIAGLTVCGFLTLGSTWAGSVEGLVALVAAGIFFSGLAAPATWAATIDVGGRQTAVVFAVMNMAGSVAAISIPPALGYLIGEVKAGNAQWNDVLYLQAAFYFIAALSWLLVNSKERS
jgi:MFS family permease